MVSSAYRMISLQADVLTRTQLPGVVQGAMEQETPMTGRQSNAGDEEQIAPEEEGKVFKHHKWWSAGKGGRHVLNHLRLSIQPYVLSYLISPWLEIVHVPSLRKSLGQLVTLTQGFHSCTPI
jgi:hypothetical protein